MKTSNENVIKCFVENNLNNANDECKSYTENLRCFYMQTKNIIVLKNYATILAYYDFDTNTYYLNLLKYSRTTSKIQNELQRVIDKQVQDLNGYIEFNFKLLRDKNSYFKSYDDFINTLYYLDFCK